MQRKHDMHSVCDAQDVGGVCVWWSRECARKPCCICLKPVWHTELPHAPHSTGLTADLLQKSTGQICCKGAQGSQQICCKGGERGGSGFMKWEEGAEWCTQEP